MPSSPEIAYKNFIKNIGTTPNCDTYFFLIRPYLWYNWYMKKCEFMAKSYIQYQADVSTRIFLQLHKLYTL